FLFNYLRDLKKRLILFDFDGTITTKDTFLEFIKFYHGSFNFVLGFLIMSPWLILLKTKVLPNYKVKERVLQWFFKDESIEVFNKQSEAICKTIVPTLVRPKALEEIQKYKRDGATVVVISASAENWVKPWCLTNDLNCLATQLEIEKNKITGKIKGFNCYG